MLLGLFAVHENRPVYIDTMEVEKDIAACKWKNSMAGGADATGDRGEGSVKDRSSMWQGLTYRTGKIHVVAWRCNRPEGHLSLFEYKYRREKRRVKQRSA